MPLVLAGCDWLMGVWRWKGSVGLGGGDSVIMSFILGMFFFWGERTGWMGLEEGALRRVDLMR